MANTVKMAGLLALFWVFVLVVPARSEEVPATGVIGQFYDTLLDVMKHGRTLGFDGRYAQLKPTIEATFNLPLMSRLSVGPQWSTLAPEEQRRLTEAFSQFTISTYASRFEDYSGERFETLPDTVAANGGIIVQSRLIKDNGEAITLNYLMRQADGHWQAVDVFLSGTISELATRRAEFTSVLRRDGAQGLLQLLDQRIANLKVS